MTGADAVVRLRRRPHFCTVAAPNPVRSAPITSVVVSTRQAQPRNPPNRLRFPNVPQIGQVLCFRFFAREGILAGSEEDAKLNELRQAGVCPNCGRLIPEGKAVARGPGLFCSLECVALFHDAEFRERARRLASAPKN
jgi:hypothetical protein